MGWLTRAEPDMPTVDTAASVSRMQAALADFIPPSPWPGNVPTREAAWSIPAVAAGVQTMQVLAGFDLYRERIEDRARDEITLTKRLDPLEPLAATLAKAVEDLVLFGRCYFHVAQRDWTGQPSILRYYPPEVVTEPADTDTHPRVSMPKVGTYELDGMSVPWTDVQVWHGHWDGLLVAGAATIFAAQDWADAAGRLATMDTPSGVLHNTGADLAPDQVEELLTAWENARKTRTTAYLNASLEWEGQRFDAEQLALVDARNYQVAEVARLLNIPPGSGGANQPSASSLSYRNAQEARRDLVDITYRPYLDTVEGHMSQNVNSLHRVRMNLDSFLRADVKTTAEVAAVGLRSGFLTDREVRTMLQLPADPDGELREPQSFGATTPTEVAGETDQQVSEQEG